MVTYRGNESLDKVEVVMFRGHGKETVLLMLRLYKLRTISTSEHTGYQKMCIKVLYMNKKKILRPSRDKHNLLQPIRSVITNTKVVRKGHTRLAIAEASRVLRCIIPQCGPVPTLMHLAITSHAIAVAIERSVIRMAHNVLTQGVETMQSVMRGEGRELLALQS